MEQKKKLLENENAQSATEREGVRKPYVRPRVSEDHQFATFTLNCKMIANCSTHAPLRS